MLIFLYLLATPSRRHSVLANLWLYFLFLAIKRISKCQVLHFYLSKPFFSSAQRVQEKKFGIRIEPYTFQEQELIDAIEKLLNDTENQKRANAAAERIEKSQSKERLADRIEEVVAQFKAEHSA